MRIAVIRKGHFNAAHQLYVNSWSKERNNEVFGKCANPHFHGHNYELEVKVTGELDPVTGMLINLKDLKDIIQVEVEEYFDHKNLNIEFEEFRDSPPTTENLCVVIYQRLRKVLDPNMDLKIRLSETPRNFAEFPAD
ncbi:6-pyruvoyl trahydropterin synthase family protein [Membranihabitans marinus]|uniref:6-pyruvoyl trahydropterin synthase family protein n=1 Tax=Membranihabitans marinus TaxID=1227546 RepID=UPI001F22DA9E|nr:6-carboxytetrahydropterin synthase [Membranihabitans marinus]